jgi:hypothetical protein
MLDINLDIVIVEGLINTHYLDQAVLRILIGRLMLFLDFQRITR